MTQSHEATAWGTIAVLLFTGCIGAGLAWIGRGYWRIARTTRDGVGATALIDRLAYTGPYLLGRFFAEVSFLDAAGIRRTAQLPLPVAQWNRLREGRSLPILYSATDPERVTLGGRRMRALFEVTGATFVVLGLLIAAGVAWLLIGGLFGVGGMDLLRPSDRQHGVYLPPPPPLVVTEFRYSPTTVSILAFKLQRTPFRHYE